MEFKQLALGWQIAEQLSGLNPFSISINKNYRLKKVEFKQLALGWQIAEQLSGLNPFSISINKNYRLKIVEFFFCNKQRKIAVKSTIHRI